MLSNSYVVFQKLTRNLSHGGSTGNGEEQVDRLHMGG